MLRTVPHTVPRVGRSYEHFPDGFELHLLPRMTGTGAVEKSKRRLLAPFMEAREVGPLQKTGVQCEREEPFIGRGADYRRGGAIYRSGCRL